MHTRQTSKSAIFLQLSDLRDLNLRSGHMAYHHVSLINLYLHIRFHWNRKHFCGQTYERTL